MLKVMVSQPTDSCCDIVHKKKTLILTKTKPSMDGPFKVYLYCNKPKQRTICGCMVMYSDELYRLPNGEVKYGDSLELWGNYSGQYDQNNFLHGKVIGSFVCNKVRKLSEKELLYGMDEISNSFVEEYSNTDIDTILAFKGDREFIYGWEITDFTLFDNPMELSCFYRICKYGNDCTECPYHYYENTPSCYEEYCTIDGNVPLNTPPKGWAFVDGYKESRHHNIESEVSSNYD